MITLPIEPLPQPLRIDEGGAVRVEPTRVTLETVVYAHRAGISPAEIVDRYHALSLADVYGVLSDILRHQPDVDA